MRRMFVGLMTVLLVCGLSSPGRAAANTTTVVRGTANTGALTLTANWSSCAPSASALPLSTNHANPWGSDTKPPVTPLNGNMPQVNSGSSRYLAYTGAANYGHGPVVTAPARKAPTTVTAYAAGPSGNQRAIGVVVGYSGASAIIGYTNPVGIGARWSRLGFSTATAASSWHFFAYQAAKGSTPARWVPEAGWTLSRAESGRAAWTWRVGFLVGCGSQAPADIDLLAVTTSAGTNTYNFEGAASGVSASASTTSIRYGQSITIAARSNPSGVPLRVVRCDGPTCYYVTPSVTSSSAGPIVFTVRPEPGWVYGVRYDGTDIFGPSQASVGAIQVRPYLTAALGQRRAHLGNRVRVGGIVGPCTGAPRHLVIQRRVGHKWKKIGRALGRPCLTDGATQFASFHGAFRAKWLGRSRLRILVPARKPYAQTYSHTLRLHVTHAPVKKVTVVHYAPAPPSPPTAGGSDVAGPPPPPLVG